MQLLKLYTETDLFVEPNLTNTNRLKAVASAMSCYGKLMLKRLILLKKS